MPDIDSPQIQNSGQQQAYAIGEAPNYLSEIQGQSFGQDCNIVLCIARAYKVVPSMSEDQQVLPNWSRRVKPPIQYSK